jgi:hypothetical protein
MLFQKNSALIIYLIFDFDFANNRLIALQKFVT